MVIVVINQEIIRGCLRLSIVLSNGRTAAEWLNGASRSPSLIRSISRHVFIDHENKILMVYYGIPQPSRKINGSRGRTLTPPSLPDPQQTGRLLLTPGGVGRGSLPLRKHTPLPLPTTSREWGQMSLLMGTKSSLGPIFELVPKLRMDTKWPDGSVKTKHPRQKNTLTGRVPTTLWVPNLTSPLSRPYPLHKLRAQAKATGKTLF